MMGNAVLIAIMIIGMGGISIYLYKLDNYNIDYTCALNAGIRKHYSPNKTSLDIIKLANEYAYCHLRNDGYTKEQIQRMIGRNKKYIEEQFNELEKTRTKSARMKEYKKEYESIVRGNYGNN